jgi:hypothetical protein
MKKFALAGVITLGVIVGLGYFLLTSQFTECYGSFKTEEAAEGAADAAEDAGLGASVDHHAAEDDLPAEWAVTFDTDETGGDAAEDRETFRDVLKQEDGELGHPGDGCIERGSFE